MPKKEFHRHFLPHYQQPGQIYFLTWNLSNALPPKALLHFSNKLRELKSDIAFQKRSNAEKPVIEKLVSEYKKTRKLYFKMYENVLHNQENPSVNLSKASNTNILKEAFHFWEGRKISSFAYAVMPNHIHWVVETFKKDDNGNPVYLQDILLSVKRYSAVAINKLENRKGVLWQNESFDTTIRNNEHLQRAIDYTLHNPVKAGYVKDWKDWQGCWCGY